MAKRRYRFGMDYLSKLPLRYSLEYGWWCSDGYSIWFPVFQGHENNNEGKTQ
jgi:hypothetical protein